MTFLNSPKMVLYKKKTSPQAEGSSWTSCFAGWTRRAGRWASGSAASCAAGWAPTSSSGRWRRRRKRASIRWGSGSPSTPSGCPCCRVYVPLTLSQEKYRLRFGRSHHRFFFCEITRLPEPEVLHRLLGDGEPHEDEPDATWRKLAGRKKKSFVEKLLSLFTVFVYPRCSTKREFATRPARSTWTGTPRWPNRCWFNLSHSKLKLEDTQRQILVQLL